jgi:hypothetical protein
LNILGDGATLLDEENGFLLPLLVIVRGVKNTEQLVKKGGVSLQMLNNIDLVEEDE